MEQQQCGVVAQQTDLRLLRAGHARAYTLLPPRSAAAAKRVLVVRAPIRSLQIRSTKASVGLVYETK